MFRFLLNPLPKVDIWFFAIIAAVIIGLVIYYFLIPVIHRKEYQAQRENLKKREKVFKANLRTDLPKIEPLKEETEEEQKEE